jgi:hypothetical protein
VLDDMYPYIVFMISFTVYDTLHSAQFIARWWGFLRLRRIHSYSVSAFLSLIWPRKLIVLTTPNEIPTLEAKAAQMLTIMIISVTKYTSSSI